MLPPSWKSEVQKTVEEAANATGERQKADNEKYSAEIASAIKSFIDAFNAQSNKPERKDKIKRFLDIATVVLLFGTAVFTGLGWLVFREQLGEMQKVYTPIKNSADAAKNAAAAAEKSFVAGTRAWLMPRDVEHLRCNLHRDLPMNHVVCYFP